MVFTGMQQHRRCGLRNDLHSDGISTVLVWSDERLIADIDETVALLQEAQVRNLTAEVVLGEYVLK